MFDVERVVIAFSNEPEPSTLELIRELKRLTVQIDIVPRLFEIVGPSVDIHSVEGTPLIGLRPLRLSPSSRLLKRTLDIFVSLAVLTITAPLFALIAWQIKRDSAGPVFFRQARIGERMRTFTALKFRTMHVGTSSEAHEAYIRESLANGSTQSNGRTQRERSEVTRVGRWLRKTSLDELPQLINVLRGDMSLVGPRPCIPYEVEHFDPHHFDRFEVPAGLTGLWQVTARAHGSFREALDLDVAYARSWSFGLDIRLLLRTPLQVLRPSGTR